MFRTGIGRFSSFILLGWLGYFPKSKDGLNRMIMGSWWGFFVWHTCVRRERNFWTFLWLFDHMTLITDYFGNNNRLVDFYEYCIQKEISGNHSINEDCQVNELKLLPHRFFWCRIVWLFNFFHVSAGCADLFAFRFYYQIDIISELKYHHQHNNGQYNCNNFPYINVFPQHEIQNGSHRKFWRNVWQSTKLFWINWFSRKQF